MFKFETPVLMLDIETSGLKEGENGILEIGMSVLHKDGSFTDDFSQTIKLEKSWGDVVVQAAMDVNHIDLESHNKVSLSNRAVQKLVDSHMQLLKEKYGRKLAFSGHNLVAFDIRFMQFWMNNSRSSVPNNAETWYDVYFGWLNPVLDTKLLFGNLKHYQELGLKSLKKDDILEWYNIDKSHGALHRALPDCRYEGEILLHMFRSGLLNTTQSLAEISPAKMKIFNDSVKTISALGKLVEDIKANKM